MTLDRLLTDEPIEPLPPRWRWHERDLESRLGVRAGRFPRVHHTLWASAALVSSVLIYGVLSWLPPSRWTALFTERGPVQYVVVFLTCWSLWLLFAKWFKLRLQWLPLEARDLVPERGDFVLSPATANEVLVKLRRDADDPAAFLLLRRIEVALSNLKNMGQIADVERVLNAQAEHDEDALATSHTVITGLLWAIPVLGFIGTVQGLSVAIGRFASVLSGAQDLAALRPALEEVTGGLATAFDTTLLALLAAVLVHFVAVAVRKAEEELLDAIKEYCQRHVIGRLRLLPFREEEGAAAP